jgi:hypothetical protein
MKQQRILPGSICITLCSTSLQMCLLLPSPNTLIYVILVKVSMRYLNRLDYSHPSWTYVGLQAHKLCVRWYIKIMPDLSVFQRFGICGKQQQAPKPLVLLKNSLYWDTTPCESDECKTGFLRLMPATDWFLAWLTFQPWRWRRHVPRNFGWLSLDYTGS